MKIPHGVETNREILLNRISLVNGLSPDARSKVVDAVIVAVTAELEFKKKALPQEGVR